MSDELIDICDEDNNLLGKTEMKSQAHSQGLWHRVAHVWIYNSKGEVLLQLRAKDKPLYPDVWDVSAAGHISAGEDPFASALRETQEEIGLAPGKDELEFWKIKKISATYGNIRNNEFCYDYLFRFDGDITRLRLQEEEVQEVRLFPIDEILKDLRERPERFASHGDYWLEVLEEIRKRIKVLTAGSDCEHED